VDVRSAAVGLLGSRVRMLLRARMYITFFLLCVVYVAASAKG
jgi:hypothetical protein